MASRGTPGRWRTTAGGDLLLVRALGVVREGEEDELVVEE